MKAGVLPYQEIKKLIATGDVYSLEGIREEQIQPSSLDLTVGNKCYLLDSSFLPEKMSVVDAMQPRVIHSFDFGADGLPLSKGAVYLFPLNEKVRLPDNLKARANPKSSTGRNDLFTRVISDFSDKYDVVKGANLWLEVAPLSYPVIIRPNHSLSQVRFYSGEPGLNRGQIKSLHQRSPLVYDQSGKPLENLILEENCLSLSINLDLDVIGYKVTGNPKGVADLTKKGHTKEKFWDVEKRSPELKLTLDPNDFWILATKERIKLPADYCAEVVPFDAQYGELRVHYAGFIDPGFEGDLTLEVRANAVPCTIPDGRIITKIRIEKLTEKSEKEYGAKIGSSYKDSKGPKLSKIFY